MGAERQTQSDVKTRELVVSIEAVKRQGRTRQADLHMEITVDREVSLQTIR